MFRKLFILFWAVVLSLASHAQLSTNPVLPVNTKTVTITFDSSKDSRLGFFTSDLYAHTGVYLAGTSGWKHVIGSWGDNSKQPKLTNMGSGIYELAITPDINTFYSVATSELVTSMNFVFRSADGSKQTNDLFVNVSADGLHVTITSPSRVNVFDKSESFKFTVSTTQAADVKLFQNNEEIGGQTSVTTLSQTLSLPNSGNYWLKAVATQNTTIKKDSIFVCIREATTNESRPAGLQPGITYNDNQSATLAIYAPGKKHIFAVGDFNNWFPDNSYQLKKDGDYYWIKLNNLIPQKEYVFQYLIDGNLKVADPYTDKVSDPEDKNISSTIYPNLIAYPEGKASDRASYYKQHKYLTPGIQHFTPYHKQVNYQFMNCTFAILQPNVRLKQFRPNSIT